MSVLIGGHGHPDPGAEVAAKERCPLCGGMKKPRFFPSIDCGGCGHRFCQKHAGWTPDGFRCRRCTGKRAA